MNPTDYICARLSDDGNVIILCVDESYPLCENVQRENMHADDDCVFIVRVDEVEEDFKTEAAMFCACERAQKCIGDRSDWDVISFWADSADGCRQTVALKVPRHEHVIDVFRAWQHAHRAWRLPYAEIGVRDNVPHWVR